MTRGRNAVGMIRTCGMRACRQLIDSGQEIARRYRQRLLRARQAYRQKSLFPQAVDDYNAAINANPSLIDAYGDRGITLTILGRFADAIPDFTRVIDAYPHLAFRITTADVCYELIGLDDLAIEDITTSIEIEPRAEFRFERRGTIYFRKNLLDKALADYEAALVINPQYASGALRPRRHPHAKRRSRRAEAPMSPPPHIIARTSPPKWPAPA